MKMYNYFLIFIIMKLKVYSKLLKPLVLILTVPLLFEFNVEAQKKVVVVEPEITTPQKQGKILKRKVAIGRFSNETEYGKGLFYDKENDPMGKQALDILSAKLGESGKFILIERNDMASLLAESQNKEENAQKMIGADYLIIGSITEFGRKSTGQSKVFSSSKTQTVEAAVSIRIVDTSTGIVIYSDEGKGSAELTTKQSLGLGGSASYDATLSDKAISAAITQLVENIINKCTNKPWRSYFLSSDADATIIAGGQSQGIEAGMQFVAKTKGKKVKNPQTGIMIELPGKTVATMNVVSTGGDTPETEYSIVSLTNGTIDANNLANYYIEEIK
jgi:curli biogenesis system outer membrane secretion channel CsgG